MKKQNAFAWGPQNQPNYTSYSAFSTLSLKTRIYTNKFGKQHYLYDEKLKLYNDPI